MSPTKPTHTSHISAFMQDRVVEAMESLHPGLPASLLARIQTDVAKDPSHGDVATNAALLCAKIAGQHPRALADALAARLGALPEVRTAQVAGPGFVNLFLAEDYLRAQIPLILAAGTDYGSSTIGAGTRINVEYVSANPTGPLHVGHCRGAVVGDVLAALLDKAGWTVTREYYLNDAGAQVQALAWAAYWRILQAAGDNARPGVPTGSAATPEAFEESFGVTLQYRGEYLIPVGEDLWAAHGKDWLPVPAGQDPTGLAPEPLAKGWAIQKAWLDQARDVAIAAMMKEISADLALLGVAPQVVISEADLVARNAVSQALALLDAKGLLYQGVLEPPLGKTPDDWEPREQILFRATELGDDVDRALLKADGSSTYFANDIANHADKIARGHEHLVQVWGADHGGYVKRMGAAVSALSDRRVPLDVLLCQVVRVVKNGEPVRMSKRAGTYITLRDLLQAVGRDAVRFHMLTRKSDAQMDFDIDRVMEQSRDNPVYYVQYAHARARSVLRAAGEPAAWADVPLDLLTDPAELALIRQLAIWPKVVEQAALAKEPHRVAFYLQEVATAFHLLWHGGRTDPSKRLIVEDSPETTQARLALVAATATVLRSALAVIGIEPAEELR